MMKKLLGLALVAALCASARADTIELTNGKKIEGRVVKSSARTVRIEVLGGAIEIPRDQVKAIQEGPTALDEYAERSVKLDWEDPEAIERLARWARFKGLDEQGKNLEQAAAGIRLEKRVAAARHSNNPAVYVAVADWARACGHSRQVRRWLLERALQLDPASRDAKGALKALESEEQAEQADQTRPERAQAPAAPAKDEATADETEKLRAERDQLAHEVDKLKVRDEEREESIQRVRRAAALAALSKTVDPDGKKTTTVLVESPECGGMILVRRRVQAPPPPPPPDAGAPADPRAAARSSSR